MKPITFLTLQLLAVLFMLIDSHEGANVLLGGERDADPNDPEIKKLLVQVLVGQNVDYDIIKVIKAKTQLVAGSMYIIDFEVKDRKTNKAKICSTTFVVQVWISDLPAITHFLCHDKLSKSN